MINSEGASTLSDLYNGKFEGEELRWNKGKPNTELITRYYDHLDSEELDQNTKATAIQIGRPANILKGYVHLNLQMVLQQLFLMQKCLMECL